MRENTERLIQEMLSFIVDKDEGNLNILKHAEKELGKLTLFVLTRDLLEWNNPIFIGINNFDEKRMDLLNDERKETYKDSMSILLNTTPELNNMFIIKDKYLLFSDTFDQEEINDLREFIQNNKLIKIQSKETRKLK